MNVSCVIAVSCVLLFVSICMFWCFAYRCICVFFFQAEDGIRDLVRSRGLGDVYKRQRFGRGDALDGGGAGDVEDVDGRAHVGGDVDDAPGRFPFQLGRPAPWVPVRGRAPGGQVAGDERGNDVPVLGMDDGLRADLGRSLQRQQQVAVGQAQALSHIEPVSYTHLTPPTSDLG